MKRLKWLGLFFVMFLSIGAVFSGCGQSTGGSADGALETVNIMIKGSDSEVNLVTRLAEEFMLQNKHVIIAVTGGGSGVGIASLIDGDIDIANSSRPMKDSEKADLKAKQGQDPYAVRFAVDGVAVIVLPDNPIDEITVEDLGRVYRGEVTNWKEIGGADQSINLYGRQSTSGTYVFFMESVLKGEYAPTMRNLGGNADIVEAIKSDGSGVGYVAIGYAAEDGKPATGLKALKVSGAAGQEAYSPVVLANIISGSYPLTRPLYQYIIGKPTGAILEFLKFETSDAGQAFVLEEGFYPITDEDKSFNREALQE
jgi:phosphate transport system substrate-binding protein